MGGGIDSNSTGSGGEGGGGGCSSLTHEEQLEERPVSDASASAEPSCPPRESKKQRGAGVASSSDSPPPAKKSRRPVQKRVVMTVPIAELDGGSRPKWSGEGAPPSDSWAWRKYGQKPIKGSPYPRGYYRCSSSKGCPAKKQVERSRADPSVLVVTYACDHNHPWPIHKSNNNNNHPVTSNSGNSQKPKQVPEPEREDASPPLPAASDLVTSGPGTPADTFNTSSSSSASFSADLGEESSLVLMTASADELCWYPDMTETSLHGELAMMLLPVSYEAFTVESCKSGGARVGGGEEVEESLFAGLGELPGCSVVFRQDPERRGCCPTDSSWCGNCR